jgi:hypothetical protein
MLKSARVPAPVVDIDVVEALQQRTAEIAKLNDQILSLQKKHAEEISEANRKHAEDLKQRAAAAAERAEKQEIEAEKRLRDIIRGDLEYQAEKISEKRKIKLAEIKAQSGQSMLDAFEYERQKTRMQNEDLDDRALKNNDIDRITWEYEKDKIEFRHQFQQQQKRRREEKASDRND